MIGAVNNNYQVQNKTNFGAVTRVVGVHVNGAMSNNPKEWNSLLNHTINVLMKRDEAEPRNLDAQKINGAIRAAFQTRIADYTVPPAYRYATRTLTDSPRLLLRSLEDNHRGITSLYILTGKDACRLEDASMKVKEANSIRPFPEQMRDKALVEKITKDREAALEIARSDYGQTARDILREAKGKIQDIELFGTKRKPKSMTKVTPKAISFKTIPMEIPPSAPQARRATPAEAPKVDVLDSYQPKAKLVLRNDRIVNAIIPKGKKPKPKTNPRQTDLFA